MTLFKLSRQGLSQLEYNTTTATTLLYCYQMLSSLTVWHWFWFAMTAWFSCRSGSWRRRAGRRGWCTWRRSTSKSCKSENIKCKFSLSISISIQQTCPTWLMSRLVEKKTFNVKAPKILRYALLCVLELHTLFNILDKDPLQRTPQNLFLYLSWDRKVHWN